MNILRIQEFQEDRTIKEEPAKMLRHSTKSPTRRKKQRTYILRDATTGKINSRETQSLAKFNKTREGEVSLSKKDL